MELLSNPIISVYLRSSFNSKRFPEEINRNNSGILDINNQYFGIIMTECSSDSSDCSDKKSLCLENIFDDILKNKKIDHNYFVMRKIFSGPESFDSRFILKKLIEVTEKKINIIKDAIKSSNYNIITYNQIWEDYVRFNNNIINIIKLYKGNLTKKIIPTGKIYFSIVEIIQLCMFYTEILKNSEKELLSLNEENLQQNLDKKNIDQLVHYTNSIRLFIRMQSFIDVNKNVIIGIISNIMHQLYVIDGLCLSLHNTIVNDTNQIDKKKLYGTLSILATYSDKEKLFICYKKFLQVRLINPNYTKEKLEMEIQFITRISGIIGEQYAQNLMNLISDIVDSRNLTRALCSHSDTIKIVSDKYKKMICPRSVNIIQPIILSEDNWYVVTKTNSDIIYPQKISYCLDVVSKIFSMSVDGKFRIKWQPMLGSAKFKTFLGGKTVNVSCNILQAIAFEYINTHTVINIKGFSSETKLSHELSSKIIESLLSANILIQIENSKNDNFSVNFHNYTEDSDIDINQYFIETFEKD